MTDNDIIKALECCSGNGGCDECPYDDKECGYEQDAIDLIKRLQAERDYWISQYTIKCAPVSATAIAATAFQERIRIEHERRMHDKIERLTIERDEARRDCAVAEKNHQTAINDFKAALLKKMFPYDVVDRKQYSINAYAVEKAIEEVAEQMTRGTK